MKEDVLKELVFELMGDEFYQYIDFMNNREIIQEKDNIQVELIQLLNELQRINKEDNLCGQY